MAIPAAPAAQMSRCHSVSSFRPTPRAVTPQPQMRPMNAVPMATVTSVSNTVTASPVASPLVTTLKAAVAFEEAKESPKAKAAKASLAWELPYPARAPKSPRRGPRTLERQRSESQKRCQELYEDHEIRLRKWQAKVNEKAKKEEDEIQKNMKNTCRLRNFNEHAFQNWSAQKTHLVSALEVQR